MLDEHDRRALAEIERELSRQDPTFATRMAGPGEDRRFPTILALCVSLYVLLPMVMLLFGGRATMLVFGVFALVIAAVLARRGVGRAGR